MKIGIDARKLRDGGIGTYVRNLLAAVRRIPSEHRFTAFVAREDFGALHLASDRAGERPRPLDEVEVRAGKYSVLDHWDLARAARRARVDLFHAPHYTLPLGWSGASVVTIHDLTHVRLAHFFPAGVALYARWVAGAAARRARRVIADSEHAKSDIVSMLKVPASHVRVVALGVSARIRRRPRDQVSRFVRDRSLPGEYLLYVGARKRHKNLQLVLRSIALIRPDVRPPLVLSGTRWERDDPHARLVEQLGLSGNVHFAGLMRDDGELACLYSGASLYVQPSLAEGFGLPPLEAMACGVPVLASRSGALPEVLGPDAVLVDPADLPAWSAGIETLLGDRAKREALGRAGLERAHAYTWERTARLTLAIYEEAMAD